MLANPVLVQMTRGSLVENFFRGAYAIMDARGQLIGAEGDCDRPVYARSALKPVQALGLLASGAAEAFNVSLPEIALACASHNGEDAHVTIVEKWLGRMGLTGDVLECGIHAPLGKEANALLVRQGGAAEEVHNACSGKHTGFITQALHLKVPVKGYSHMAHPVQQYTNSVIEDVTGINIADAPKGMDGCQIPVIGMPLKNLAMGMASLANPESLIAPLEQGARKIREALQGYPHLIAGTGRICSDIIQKTKGGILPKMGADGVFSVILPKKGLGIALKMDDGHLLAAEVALMGILKKHDFLPENEDWDAWANPAVRTRSHQVAGQFSFAG